MPRYAVLLRGINLGRSRRVAMADLRALLADQGYQRVATLLQSGNVVLDADQRPEQLRPMIEAAIEQRFGFGVDVIVRSREELARVITTNPLREVATDGSKYVVVFLAELPTTPMDDVLAGVEPGEDRYVLDGAELYLWCPDGLTRSPLMAALGKARGGPTATVRNWNTVQKLYAMMD